MPQNKEDGLSGKHSRPAYIAVIVLFLVFALSITALFSNYFNTKKELEEDFTQEKIVHVRYTAREVEDFLTHEQVALSNIAGFLSLSGSLDKGRTVLEQFLKSHNRQPKFFSFLVLDPNGRFLYSVPESLDDRHMQDLSQERFFSDVAKQGGDSYSSIGAAKAGETSIIYSVPVRRGGKLLGVLVGKVNVKALEQMYIGKLATIFWRHCPPVRRQGRCPCTAGA